MDHKWLIWLWENLVRFTLYNNYHWPIIAILLSCFLTEFSFLIRYYNLLYQSLIPNCKLTIKILKQHLEIPSDVESFIINGESSRIRCQRIINLLLVQLDTTRDYKNFCYVFNMITVMTDLPNKLKTGDCCNFVCTEFSSILSQGLITATKEILALTN